MRLVGEHDLRLETCKMNNADLEGECWIYVPYHPRTSPVLRGILSCYARLDGNPASTNISVMHKSTDPRWKWRAEHGNSK